MKKISTVLALSLALAGPAAAGGLDSHLNRLADGGRDVSGKFTALSGDSAHVFIDADSAAIPGLLAAGAKIHTLLPSGLMTAEVPVQMLRAAAAIAGVRSIEAAKPVEMRMDTALGPIGMNVPGEGDPSHLAGQGVLVGVIDSGVDTSHPDFFDANGDSRIVAVWDHTLDSTDVGGVAAPPAGYSYGTEWTRQHIHDGTVVTADENGHGTHVLGTIAGGGKAHSAEDTTAPNGHRGSAYLSEIVVVEFDFDNVKQRNSDANIVDGVAYLMGKADELGRPIAINMSLGSDYGPHDGSQADERGIDELTGPGKIVVVAAGNAGRSNTSPNRALWGAPLHGAHDLGDGAPDAITVDTTNFVATDGTDNDYVFFDGWYPGGSEFRVQITTPSGKKYPSSFGGRNRTLWKTNGNAGGFCTPEGFIYVANMNGADTFWEATNGDNNLYIEISDYSSTTCAGSEPAAGTWTIDIIDASGGGELHAWNGSAGGMTAADIAHNGVESDNALTVGSPGTAASVVTVGAYMTKACWPAMDLGDGDKDGVTDELITQCYGVYPIDYYDPMFVEDLAFFSSRGPSRDGRVLPDISAPGVGIVAALSKDAWDLADPTTYYPRLNRVSPSGMYATLQGTSMATPNATGAIILLLEQALATGAQMTPDAVKGYLAGGARDDGFTGSVPNNDWGAGKVDVTASLPFVVAQPNQAPTADAGGDQSVKDGDESGDEVITLDGSGSSDSDGSIVSYSWSVGGVEVATGATANVTQAVADGTVTYTLTVTDDGGLTATDTVDVTVTAGGKSKGGGGGGGGGGKPNR
jgi:subtilisin family serine protease